MPEKRYLTVTEAADYLCVSAKTVRNWISARKIPFIKMGGRVLFSIEALDAWLASKVVEPLGTDRGGR